MNKSLDRFLMFLSLISHVLCASAHLSGDLGVHHMKGLVLNPIKSIKIPSPFLRLCGRGSNLQGTVTVHQHIQSISLSVSPEEIGTNASIVCSCDKTKISAQWDCHLPCCTEQPRPCLYCFI